MSGMNLKGNSKLIQWLSSYVRIEKNFYTMPFPVDEKTTIQVWHVNGREELVDRWIRKLFSSYLAPKLQYPGEE